MGKVDRGLSQSTFFNSEVIDVGPADEDDLPSNNGNPHPTQVIVLPWEL
jgi:hypothetical protein